MLYSASRPRITKVLSTDTAAIMTAMMRTVIDHGTGLAARIGKPAAGKTGTTDDYKDAWFVGYTPTIVMGVWVGNDDNTRMGGLTGGTVPALIWRDIMKVAVESIGSDDFQYPEVVLDGAPKKNNPKLTSDKNIQSNESRIEDEESAEVPMTVVTPVQHQPVEVPAVQQPVSNSSRIESPVPSSTPSAPSAPSAAQQAPVPAPAMN